MTEQNLASVAELKEINSKIAALVDEAVEFAQSSPEPSPSDLHRYIFAED